MKPQNFQKAVGIIAQNHSSKVVINHVERNAQVNVGIDNPTIHIISCCPSVINNLKESNFTLGMEKGMMSVEDYSIRVKDAIEDLKPYSAG